jgi:REP element-mobilizing transposase RayT
MPCFLFTYHAWGSWLPDRKQGYVHWKEGLLPPDQGMADAYRRNIKIDEAEFGEELQLLLIEELQQAAGFQKFRLHAAATEVTHIHLLMSWADERTTARLSEGIKKSLTLRLEKEAAKRKWLAKGGSKRRVKDETHFNHLKSAYLPSHRGWKWDEQRGLYK